MLPDVTWGLPGARLSPPLPGVAGFSATPLLHLLRQAAARNPQAIALASLGESLSHGALLAQAMQVAAAIARLVPPGAPVACLMPQRPQGMAGLLGCLLAGRLCLVLNPAEPAERLAALLADAAPVALLLAAPLAVPCAAPALMLGEILAGPATEWQLDHAWNPEAPLAVHFTSGSSGRPKGIVLSARSLLARPFEAMHYWRLGPADVVLATSLPSTSAGLAFLLAALLAGGRALVTHIGAEGAAAVLKLAGREAVTCAAGGPALWRLMLGLAAAPRAFRALRLLRVGNAAVVPAELAAWRGLLPPGCQVQHTYASTEALVMAQWLVPPGKQPGAATLAAGQAEATHEMALLDAAGQPVPAGEAGELVLRGPLLALGEWQGGRLVPGRLPAEPGRPGWRRFHTGDLVRVAPDGLLRVVGRADRQVKINGVRVEPAEIEAVLRAEPGVVDAAVLAGTVAGRTVLQGFVAAPGLAEATLLPALRQRLAAGLPSAFRPARLVVLERLPRLAGNGKLDQAALLGLP